MDAPAGRADRSAKRYCGLGNHYLQEPHTTIKDPNLLKFARKLNNELRTTTLICATCLDVLQTAYATKLRNAIRHHRKRQAAQSKSISDVSYSQSSSDQPTTSAAAAAKRQRTAAEPKRCDPSSTTTEEDDDSMLSLNAVNGTRLPHVQPIPKRRQVARKGPELDIYLAGTTGG